MKKKNWEKIFDARFTHIEASVPDITNPPYRIRASCTNSIKEFIRVISREYDKINTCWLCMYSGLNGDEYNILPGDRIFHTKKQVLEYIKQQGLQRYKMKPIKIEVKLLK